MFLSNNRKYPQLYELANQIITYVERNRDVTFPRFPTKSHRSTHIRTVAKVIFTHREFKDNVFYLPQSVLSTHLRSKWGLDNEAIGSIPSDKARVFGILMDESFRDELHILLGKKTPSSKVVGSSRHESDDPSYRSRNIWNRVKSCFHEESFKITNPRNWVSASMVEGFEDIDPNDPIRLRCHSSRSIDWFKLHLFKDTLSLYRKAAGKWRKDTGNGRGQPENFMDWNPNEDAKFATFTNDQQSALLTWIYMKDRECHYILEREQDDLPLDAQITDQKKTDARRSPSSYMAKTIDAMSKSIQGTANLLHQSMKSEAEAKIEMNPFEMARTLQMTEELLQKRGSSDSTNERQKRMRATLEAIQDEVMNKVLD